MALLEDVITYLEMLSKPASPPPPAPFQKLALMRTEPCTVSYYRYLYGAVGEPWLWFERRIISDAELAEILDRPTIEIFVLYVGGVPAGYFELDTGQPRETKILYFGLVPDFIGRRLGPFLLREAIDQAWSRPIDRLWLHTSRFDHPKALQTYQKAGFTVYDRRRVVFEDPRLSGLVPPNFTHRLLPPLAPSGR